MARDGEEQQAMSDERLAEIRGKLKPGYLSWLDEAGIMPVHVVAARDLLAEVERLRMREAALVAVVRAVATSNPYGSWLPPVDAPAGVVCRWCMERAYAPAQCQHDLECTWRQARALLASTDERRR